MLINRLPKTRHAIAHTIDARNAVISSFSQSDLWAFNLRTGISVLALHGTHAVAISARDELCLHWMLDWMRFGDACTTLVSPSLGTG